MFSFRRILHLILLMGADVILSSQININKLKESKIYNIKVPFEPHQFLQGLSGLVERQDVGQSDFIIQSFIKNLKKIDISETLTANEELSPENKKQNGSEMISTQPPTEVFELLKPSATTYSPITEITAPILTTIVSTIRHQEYL